MNNAGPIVGRYRIAGSGVIQGLIRDSDGSVRTYNLPGAAQNHLFGVNDLGQIVGYYSSSSFTGKRGFLLDNALDTDHANDTFTDITYAGPGITGKAGIRAYAINDSGTITGTYNGFTQAYIAVVPEPAAVSVLAVAGVITLRGRARSN